MRPPRLDAPQLPVDEQSIHLNPVRARHLDPRVEELESLRRGEACGEDGMYHGDETFRDRMLEEIDTAVSG